MASRLPKIRRQNARPMSSSLLKRPGDYFDFYLMSLQVIILNLKVRHEKNNKKKETLRKVYNS